MALLFIASCAPVEEPIDIEKEKEAIKAIVETESNSYYARDMESQFACFVQDESLTGVLAGKDGFYSGWEMISEVYKNNYEQWPESSVLKVKNENYKIKVYTETAWAVYDEYYVYKNDSMGTGPRSIRFLEKVDGEWKIVLASMLSREDTEENSEEEAEPESEGTE